VVINLLIFTGTLLVNDVVAGCYANVQSHEAAQFYMTPLRFYFRLARALSMSKPFGDQNSDGIHFVLRIMIKFGQLFRPSTLCFT